MKESTKISEATERTTSKSAEIRDNSESLTNEMEALSATTNDFENQVLSLIYLLNIQSLKAISDTERSNEVAKKATLAESTSKILQEKLSVSEKKLQSALDQLSKE